MTEALAIALVAVLFVAFALMQRQTPAGGCQPEDCDSRDAELGCGGCRQAEDAPETSDAAR